MPVDKLLSLAARHYAAIRLHVDGLRYCDIAKRLGLSPLTIRSWFNDRLFVNTVKKMADDRTRLWLESQTRVDAADPVKRAVGQKKVAAVERLISLMETSESEKMQFDTATEILKLSGAYESAQGGRALVVLGRDALEWLESGLRDALRGPAPPLPSPDCPTDQDGEPVPVLLEQESP